MKSRLKRTGMDPVRLATAVGGVMGVRMHHHGIELPDEAVTDIASGLLVAYLAGTGQLQDLDDLRQVTKFLPTNLGFATTFHAAFHLANDQPSPEEVAAGGPVSAEATPLDDGAVQVRWWMTEREFTRVIPADLVEMFPFHPDQFWGWLTVGAALLIRGVIEGESTGEPPTPVPTEVI